MIKFVALMKRKPGMTLDAFIARYEDHHALFARPHLPRAIRYRRRYLRPLANPLTGESGEGDFDVITEVWFADEAAMAADLGRISSAEISAAFDADEKHLFDQPRHRLFVVAEEADTALDDAPI